MKQNFSKAAKVLVLAVALMTTSAWGATITSVSPNSGPPLGGTAVTITGTSFDKTVSSVMFGSNNATNVVFDSATSITATSPASTSTGAVPVYVTGATFGTITLDNGFTYVTPTPPVITSPLTIAGAVGVPFSYTITASGSTPITFTATPLPAGLTLSGATISGKPTTAGIVNVTMMASNGTPPTNSQILVITITPTSVAPIITSPLTIAGAIGIPFNYTITANGTAPITFTAAPLPAGLTFSGSTITGTPTTASVVSVILGASNTTAPDDSKTLLITITPTFIPPTITSPLTASGTFGTPFSYTMTATGTAPLSFTAVSLPAGLTFSGSTISGTPTTPTLNTVVPTNVLLTASNGTDSKDSKTLVITIYPTNTIPIITSPLTASGIVGTPFSYTITAAGATPITFIATPLPAGLTFSGATISGTPTAVGVTNVTLGASNGQSPNDSKTLVITITATAPTITSELKATGLVGVDFSYTLTATGSPPIIFAASPLPDGLKLTGATIAGKPTLKGVTKVTLGATNNSTVNSVKILELTINDVAPSITNALTATGTVGVAFEFTLTATGLTPIAFTANPLPAGLTLAGSKIFGIPTTAGIISIALVASNGNLPNDNKTLLITINPAPVAPIITSGLSTSGVAGSPFSYAITASGTTPITYSTSTLPAGLVFEGATISGTPTSTGVSSVILSASNKTNPNDIKVLVITINAANTAPVINSPLTAAGGVGVAFSYTLTSNTSTPTTFTASPLPDGLTLSGATISGTPTTAGVTSVILTASNGTAPDDTSKILILTIGVPPLITSELKATGLVGVAFSYALTTNTNAPTTFTASPLPAGLTLSGATISGTPSTAGVTIVVLSASNGTLPNDTKTLIITIISPPHINSPLTPTGLVGIPFSYTITASGVTPITFTASPLPDGLKLTGATISGIPTTAGIFAITLGASNGTAPDDSKTLTITVSLPQVAKPIFNLSEGIYTGTQNVTVSTATSDAAIYYTTDGSTPTKDSNLYSAAIPISATTTLKALAIKDGMNTSAITSATYTIITQVAIPTFSLAGGTYISTQSVTISTTTPGATIYCTLNGSAPIQYSSAILISTTTTLSAWATKSGLTDSPNAIATYFFNASSNIFLTPSPAKVGQQVNAFAAVESSAATYSWDFGDGSAAVDGATATHIYTATGTYTVTVTITIDGVSTTQSLSLTVTAAPPLLLNASLNFKDAYTIKDVAGTGVASSTLGISSKITLPTGKTIADNDVITITTDEYSFSNTFNNATKKTSGKSYTFNQTDIDSNGKTVKTGSVSVRISKNTVTVTVTLKGMGRYKNGTSNIVAKKLSGGAVTTGSTMIKIELGSVSAVFAPLYSGKSSFKKDKNGINAGTISLSGSDTKGTISSK